MNRLSILVLSSLPAVFAGCGGDSASVSTVSTASAASPTSVTAQSQVMSPDTSCALGDFSRQLVEQINRARAESRYCGTRFFKAVAPLAWNDRLFAAAADHARDMAAQDYLSHTSPEGISFGQRITAAGYAWSAAAENIAGGPADVAQAVDGWLKSPGHCENIMTSGYADVAAACVQNDGARYRRYWAMELARPK